MLFRLIPSFIVSCLLFTLSLNVATAQTRTVLSSGLKGLTKIILMPGGDLLVAEAGGGSNDGRISIIDHVTGEQHTLVDGLPSAKDSTATETGPTGMAIQDRVLYVSIGIGDLLRSSGLIPQPGVGPLNPNPSAPIFSSILTLTFATDIDLNAGPFVLEPADYDSLSRGESVVLPRDSDTKLLEVKLLVKFPDPVRESGTRYRGSDPFDLAMDSSPDRPNTLYIADGGWNAITRVNAETGQYQELTKFARLPRSSGAPVDAVPISVKQIGDRLLVGLFTGSPYPSGVAQVSEVDIATGANQTYISGLTTATDLLILGGTELYVLEYSTRIISTPPEPGRMLNFGLSSGVPAGPNVIYEDLLSPTTLTGNQETGEIFIGEFGAGGRILKVEPGS